MTHAHHGIRLATEAGRHPQVFADAFNSGDPAVLESVYVEDAVFVTAEGRLVSGAARRAANTELQALGVPIRVTVRQVHVHETSTALLVVAWEIHGRSEAADALIDVRGTATDVARRGEDGFWRYIIDNPFGIASDL